MIQCRGEREGCFSFSADENKARMCILISLRDHSLSSLTLLLSKAFVNQHWCPLNAFFPFPNTFSQKPLLFIFPTGVTQESKEGEEGASG